MRSLLLVPFIVLACGGDDDSDSSGSSAFIEEFCKELTPCCGPADEDGKVPGSGCRSFYGFASAAATYDAAAGSACLNEIKAGKADPEFCTKVSKVAPSCNDTFKSSQSTGTLQPGADCDSTRDCAPSTEGEVKCSFDRSTSASSRMVCQIEMPGKPGDGPCMGTKLGSLVTYGIEGSPHKAFICDITTSYCSKTTMKCEPVQPAGADCDPQVTYQCGETGKGSCDFSTKKCVVLKGGGEPCAGASECVSRNCVAGVCAGEPKSPNRDPSLLFVCATSD